MSKVHRQPFKIYHWKEYGIATLQNHVGGLSKATKTTDISLFKGNKRVEFRSNRYLYVNKMHLVYQGFH